MLNGTVYKFSIHYEPVDVNRLLDIHKHLIRKHNILRILKLAFVTFWILLLSISLNSNHIYLGWYSLILDPYKLNYNQLYSA